MRSIVIDENQKGSEFLSDYVDSLLKGRTGWNRLLLQISLKQDSREEPPVPLSATATIIMRIRRHCSTYGHNNNFF